MTDTPAADPHLDLFKFNHPLTHLSDSLRRRRKTRIVAIGSSTTAGEGGVIPFPARLELALRQRFPDRMIDVINRGIGGQEAPEEAARFEADVIGEAPALVIWQVGTNAIYHRTLYDPRRVAATIATGLSWLGQSDVGADVILMDLQFAPELLGDKEADARLMVSLIGEAAAAAKVNLFQRFKLMEQWIKDGIDAKTLIAADGLHQTDYATSCVTAALDATIGAAISGVTGAVA